MIKRYNEKLSSCFKGTIIDIESYGNFCRGFGDSREYKDIAPTIIGYINCDGLNILCAMGISALNELKLKIGELAPTFERPLFAFNCHFEQGVLYHSCSVKIRFDGELNQERYEPKKQAVKVLGIPNYDDPFYDGSKCKVSWLNGDYESSIKHNRSCLLKERDILVKRNHRKPEELKFFQV
jgi:hypothetical protein